jgi:hypothetical protein
MESNFTDERWHKEEAHYIGRDSFSIKVRNSEEQIMCSLDIFPASNEPVSAATKNQVSARANLIAAAPDMFAALNKCLEYFLAHNYTSGETPMAAAAAVRKALNITDGK